MPRKTFSGNIPAKDSNVQLKRPDLKPGSADTWVPPGVTNEPPIASTSRVAASLMKKDGSLILPEDIEENLGVAASLARTYSLRAELDTKASQDVSDLLLGLDELGLLANLYDAAIYTDRFQPAGSSNALSLLGHCDLDKNGSPQFKRAGVFFPNDDNSDTASGSYFYGDVPPQNGRWSILVATARATYAPSAGARVAFCAYKGSASRVLRYQTGANWQAQALANGQTVNRGRKNPFDPTYQPILAINETPSATGSYKVSDLGDAPTTITGPGRTPFDAMVIGALSTNGTSFSLFADSSISYWFIWNNPITSAQEASLVGLLETYVLKKARWVFEGDSIAGGTNGWESQLLSGKDFLGSNFELLVPAEGGAASTKRVQEIGTSTGINDSQMSSEFPVFCLIQVGSNDPGDGALDTSGPDESLANIRALWKAAKDRNMIVIACTVPFSEFIYPGEVREYWKGNSGLTTIDGFNQLNQAIRADTQNYDYLLDVDQILIDEWGADYATDVTCFPDGVHPGDSDDGCGPIVIAELYQLIKTRLP